MKTYNVIIAAIGFGLVLSLSSFASETQAPPAVVARPPAVMPNPPLVATNPPAVMPNPPLVATNPSAVMPNPPAVVTSRPVAAPPPVNNNPLSAAILAWDSDNKAIEAHVDDTEGHLVFNFTNVSPTNVVIREVAAGCHCTTPHVPAMPWTIAPGSNGQIGASIDLRGKTSVPGVVFKNLMVKTDQGVKVLNFHVNVLPVVLPTLTDTERTNDLQIARTDRQAVFKNDCIICHVKPGQGKYGKDLYDKVCAICHEGAHRSPLVPDLHAVKTAATGEFWRTWIAHGKPGSLMPAFSSTDGGPLNDTQILTLTTYLTVTFSNRPPAPAAP